MISFISSTRKNREILKGLNNIVARSENALRWFLDTHFWGFFLYVCFSKMKEKRDMVYFFMQKVRQSQMIQVEREPTNQERTRESRKNCQMESSESRARVMEKLSMRQKKKSCVQFVILNRPQLVCSCGQEMSNITGFSNTTTLEMIYKNVV